MSDARKERLAAFVEWVQKYVKGDEKGESQIFLDRLFQGFGQKGCLDVGGIANTEFANLEEMMEGPPSLITFGSPSSSSK